jgi:hypothetical protein
VAAGGMVCVLRVIVMAVVVVTVTLMSVVVVRLRHVALRDVVSVTAIPQLRRRCEEAHRRSNLAAGRGVVARNGIASAQFRASR